MAYNEKPIFQLPASHKHVQHGGFFQNKRNSCSHFVCLYVRYFFVCVFVSPFLAWSIFGSFHVSPMKKKNKKQLLEGTVVFDGRPEKIQAGLCAKWTWNIGRTSKKTQHLGEILSIKNVTKWIIPKLPPILLEWVAWIISWLLIHMTHIYSCGPPSELVSVLIQMSLPRRWRWSICESLVIATKPTWLQMEAAWWELA